MGVEKEREKLCRKKARIFLRRKGRKRGRVLESHLEDQRKGKKGDFVSAKVSLVLRASQRGKSEFLLSFFFRKGRRVSGHWFNPKVPLWGVLIFYLFILF